MFNQNGWYYPSWYPGDWQAANAALVDVQRAADMVVYQSKFCRDAGRELAGFVAERNEVIYNAVPPRAVSPRGGPQATGGPTLWLSAVFTPDAEHILVPAIAALRALRKGCDPRRAPRLLLCGRIDPQTKQTAWYRAIERDLSSLVADGACEWLGQYEPSGLPALLARADLALHLRYKDSCPNAVIERMLAGLPHVYSNSGGTPELVGSAGIGLDVGETWDRHLAVDAAALAGAIDAALHRRDELAEAARDESRRFDWGRYVARHREIFDALIETHGR